MSQTELTLPADDRSRVRTAVAVAVPVGIVVLAHVAEVAPVGQGPKLAVVLAMLAATVAVRAWPAAVCALLFALLRVYWLVVPPTLARVPVLAKGLLAPWVAHVLADATIAIVLYVMVGRG